MNGRWLKGPEALQIEEALWPVKTGSPDSIEVNTERRRIQIACPVTVSEPIFNCEDFSSYYVRQEILLEPSQQAKTSRV